MLLILGIDSLAPELLVKFEDDLPNFTRLRKLSPPLKSTSIFPVDSIPAWVSIYTGWSPGRHGIVKVFDILESDLTDILNIDINAFKGKAFWDYASRAAKKVCMLFPMLAFPPWEINGIMVSKAIATRRVKGEPEWVIEREVRATPSRVMEQYEIPRFIKGVYGKHPGINNLDKWAEGIKRALLEEAEIGLKIYRDFEGDVFFIFFEWLDILQHRLWRYMDENDPTHIAGNPYQNVIREFYQLLDGIVGEFVTLFPEATTIVLSDHGHSMRPAKSVNINKVLREKGLLFSNRKAGPLFYLMEKGKTKMLDFIKRFELDYWLVSFATKTKGLSSLSKSIYMSTASLDMGRTIAYLSSFAGVKSYSHGGIEIKRENLKGRDYEAVRDLIIEELYRLEEPDSGERLMEWACRREDLYQGPQVSQAYPDIVFHLKEGYGTYWGVHSPLIGTSYDHNLASGGHQENAVFLLVNAAKSPVRQEMSLMDIAPTVLDLLDIKGEFGFNGKSIFSSEETGIR